MVINNVCVGFAWWFLYTLLLLKIIVSMEKGYAMVFLCALLLLKIIVSMGSGYVYVWGKG